MSERRQREQQERTAEQERLKREAGEREQARVQKEMKELQKRKAQDRLEDLKKTAVGARALADISVEVGEALSLLLAVSFPGRMT